TKKALDHDQIKGIRDIALHSRSKTMYRDFWLLSFYCGGINGADLLRLKKSNYNGESISYFREKTKTTAKQVKRTDIYLVPHARQIIERYRDNSNQSQYLFS